MPEFLWFPKWYPNWNGWIRQPEFALFYWFRFDTRLIDTVWSIYPNCICNKWIKTDSWTFGKIHLPNVELPNYYNVAISPIFLTNHFIYDKGWFVISQTDRWSLRNLAFPSLSIPSSFLEADHDIHRILSKKSSDCSYSINLNQSQFLSFLKTKMFNGFLKIPLWRPPGGFSSVEALYSIIWIP